MRIQNTKTENWPLVIHGNGPSKESDKWKEVLKVYNEHTKHQQIPNKDLTLLTWSVKDEEFLLDKVMKDMGCGDYLNVILLDKEGDSINWTEKITKTLDFIKDIDTKYVMGMDALDVIPSSDEPMTLWDNIVEVFESMNCDILFNAEQYNWPSSDGHGTMLGRENHLIMRLKELEQFDERVYKEYFESEWLHLNSGCWIAKTEEMIKFYTDVKEIIDYWSFKPEYKDEGFFGGDQGFVRIMSREWFPKLIIDYNCKIFQTIAGQTDMLEVIDGT